LASASARVSMSVANSRAPLLAPQASSTVIAID
jgi:hypothetical protein